MTPPISPRDSWAPLPAADWDAEAARHLLRRAGWTARPDDVEQAVGAGLDATLDRLFPQEPQRFKKPRLIERLEEGAREQQRQLSGASAEERLRVNRELQERGRIGLQELAIKWLEYASDPANASFAKLTLFLSDVYVVSGEKVRNPAFVFEHFDIIARHALGDAPALTKAVSRSPAMVIYLDLNQSRRQAPNENFARELFELFVLGEGNYTEADIKEAARAFTGYRVNPGQGFRFVAAQHDASEKTVFGENGKLSGDDVIDLAYRQPAAAIYLPRELVRFYLTEHALPPAHWAALGEIWREAGFNLRTLVRRFFSSRLFFSPEFRKGLIKSPVQYYLGLLQDLSLNVAPLPRLTIAPLRQMGQALFHPPNVRGWVGGRQWINSATLTARRQLVELLSNPLEERTLNGDEMFELVAARSNGVTRFTLDDAALGSLTGLAPDAAAQQLALKLVGDALPAEALRDIAAFLGSDSPSTAAPRRLRRAAVTLLQSPSYQLC